MAKRVVAPSEADARNRAVLAIADAVCGYARMDGRHLCQRERIGQGLGCEPTTWNGLLKRIEDVLEGWEPVSNRSEH